MKRIISTLVFALFANLLYAQLEDPVKWAYAAERIGNNEAKVYLKAIIENKWHIYALGHNPGPLQTNISFSPSKDFILVGKVVEPKPISEYNKSLKTSLNYFEKQVVFVQKIRLNKKTATVVKGRLEFTACNDKSCLPADQVNFSVPVK